LSRTPDGIVLETVNKNWPAEHPVHATAPSPENLPTSQTTQTLAVVAPVVVEYLPLLQVTQALCAVAPVVVRYLPAPHARHVEPEFQYLPALQDVQLAELVAPDADSVPEAQLRHVPLVDAPVVVEYLPAPQSTQKLAFVAPIVAEYLPAPHLIHAVPPDVVKYCPTPQSIHVAIAEAPNVVEYLPAPQSTQTLAFVAPIVAEYLPAAHARHVEPKFQYLPATHGVQSAELMEPDAD